MKIWIKIVLFTTVVLIFTIGDVHAAEVLRGYMVAKDHSFCIHKTKTIGALAGLPLSESWLSTTCTLVSVQDGSSAACNAVTDCLTCDNDGSDGVKCLTCEKSKAPATDGASCVACGVASCDTCSADGVCDVCTGSLKPNGVGSGCFDCSSITNCEKCKADGECSACSSGMLPNAKGDACIATTTTEATTASDAGINTVSVLVIVGMTLFIMA